MSGLEPTSLKQVINRPPGRERWLMLALAWSLYASFGVIVASIPPLVIPILEDLEISNGQMGLVLGAWQFVYIFTAFPLGVVIDRIGIRKALGIGIIIALASMVLRGFATNFWTLLLAVALFGFGGPIISIGAPKVVSVWFRGAERNLAAGIYATGPVAGSAIALATAVNLVVPLTGSWRGISVVYGAVVFAIACGWWLLSRDEPGAKPKRPRPWGFGFLPIRCHSHEGSDLPPLLSIRNVQVLVVIAIGSFLVNHGLTSWLPTLLEEGGMTGGQAGAWAAVAMAMGVVGTMSMARFAVPGRRVVFMGILFTAVSVTTMGLALGGGATLITALLFTNAVRMPLMPLASLILMDTVEVGAGRVGAVIGLYFTAAEIGGFGGPFLLGMLRDATGSLTQGIVILALVAAAFVLVLPLIKENPPEGLSLRRK